MIQVNVPDHSKNHRNIRLDKLYDNCELIKTLTNTTVKGGKTKTIYMQSQDQRHYV